MAKITLITGGQRSGKSSYAQQLALARSPQPIYLATSRVWDEEHRLRIARHQADRNATRNAAGEERWQNMEEQTQLSKHDFSHRTVVVDCLTLWATNFFFDRGGETEPALEALKAEFDRLVEQPADFIFVSNEIGLGGVSENAVQRRFTDLQGWMNQYVAQRADTVVLMVAGLPITVK